MDLSTLPAIGLGLVGYVALARLVIDLQPAADRRIAVVVAVIIPLLWLAFTWWGTPSAVIGDP